MQQLRRGVFEGQQFCRACGAPTRHFPAQNFPRKLLPPPEQQPPFSTRRSPAVAPPPTRSTGRVINPIISQRAAAAAARPSLRALLHARRRRSRGLALRRPRLFVFFGGAMLCRRTLLRKSAPAAAAAAATGDRNERAHHEPAAGPAAPPLHAATGRCCWTMRDAEFRRADRHHEDLPACQRRLVRVAYISGDITVEGWEERSRGQDHQARRERSGARRFEIIREEARTASRSAPARSAWRRARSSVSVKLPRNLRELEIVSNNSNVELTGVNTTSISINVQRGTSNSKT